MWRTKIDITYVRTDDAHSHADSKWSLPKRRCKRIRLCIETRSARLTEVALTSLSSCMSGKPDRLFVQSVFVLALATAAARVACPAAYVWDISYNVRANASYSLRKP